MNKVLVRFRDQTRALTWISHLDLCSFEDGPAKTSHPQQDVGDRGVGVRSWLGWEEQSKKLIAGVQRVLTQSSILIYRADMRVVRRRSMSVVRKGVEHAGGCWFDRFCFLSCGILLNLMVFSGCGLFDSKEEIAVHVPFATSGKVVVHSILSGEVVAEDDLIVLNQEIPSEAVARVKVSANHEPLLFEALDLKFTDPATGVSMSFDKGDAWMATLPGDEIPKNITINPYTTFVYCRIEDRIASSELEGEDQINAAIVESEDIISRHLGIHSVSKVVPESPLFPIGNITEGVRYGLWLGAFSQLAADHSEETGISSGSLLTPITLGERLCRDFSEDQLFDGQGSSGIVVHGRAQLSDQTLRLDLARALYRFLGSSQNRTTLGSQDAFGLVDTVSLNASTKLFPIGSSVFPFETDAPLLTFLEPDGSSVWQGEVLKVHVVAEDTPGQVKTMTASITFPLTGVKVDVPNALSKIGAFQASVNVLEYGSGPAIFKIRAVDLVGNEAVGQLELMVKEES